MSDEIVIKTRNLSKEYRVGENAIRALDNVNVEIRRGEFVFISGKSGSGKSTMLNMLAGLESPTSGEIEILGEHIEKLSENERLRFRRKNIGFVFQSYNLMPQYTTLENIALPLAIRKMPKEKREKIARQILRLVGLEEYASHRPTELSGGQQQRVGIARAIITRPPIVFADEPTGNLDTKTSAEIMELLSGVFRKWGTTFVLVSHDLDMKKYTDRMICFSDGQVSDTSVFEEEK